MGKFDLGDYVEVKDRIVAFKEQYPDGRLTSEIVATGFDGYIAVKAYAYRTPDDPQPGVGLAWEPVPGKTPYTKDSELQNAETSAWGRAIVAGLIADASGGVASADEVRNRRTRSEPVRQDPNVAHAKTELWKLCKKDKDAAAALYTDAVTDLNLDGDALSAEDAEAVIAWATADK